MPPHGKFDDLWRWEAEGWLWREARHLSVEEFEELSDQGDFEFAASLYELLSKDERKEFDEMRRAMRVTRLELFKLGWQPDNGWSQTVFREDEDDEQATDLEISLSHIGLY